MNDDLNSKLRELIFGRLTAALGTLHEGTPYVSMAPYAILEDEPAFIIHVSRLASHTGDMLEDPHVSLLFTAHENGSTNPQALARVTIQGMARQLSSEMELYGIARAAYLGRFPDAAPIFHLGDFSLFLITASAVRWVAGFGQARSLTPISLARALKREK